MAINVPASSRSNPTPATNENEKGTATSAVPFVFKNVLV
jgi:hypothetical protein